MARPDSADMTKKDGLKLREARRARVRRIRARVIGGSIALFLAVWMLITVVLVTGHDPALARKAVTQAATPATATTTSSSTGSISSGATTSSSTGSVSSGATSSSTGSGSAGVSGVTSSQS
jgi:hypothetical protein